MCLIICCNTIPSAERSCCPHYRSDLVPEKMNPDRSWMLRRRNVNGSISEEFKDGVDEFVMLVKGHARNFDEKGYILCPCVKCKNLKRKEIWLVEKDLYNYGFLSYYQNWVVHGEKLWTKVGSVTRNVEEQNPTNAYLDTIHIPDATSTCGASQYDGASSSLEIRLINLENEIKEIKSTLEKVVSMLRGRYRRKRRQEPDEDNEDE